MKTIKETLREHKIVPVIKVNDKKNAVHLGEALCRGGLPVAEITFRTDAALDSISKMARALPEMIIGAGTITNTEQVKQAVEAGASFIVTAGFSRAVTEYCIANTISIFPGVCTPSEVMWLLEYGLDTAKFFPAEQYGGLETIKALSAPFPNMHFMPTGGIGEHNIKEYLKFEKVIACGGSWMVKEELIDEGKFDVITEMTRKAVKLVG